MNASFFLVTGMKTQWLELAQLPGAMRWTWNRGRYSSEWTNRSPGSCQPQTTHLGFTIKETLSCLWHGYLGLPVIAFPPRVLVHVGAQ